MFNDNYDADYKQKFQLFTDLIAAKLGPATDANSLRQKLSRIQLKGAAANTIPLTGETTQLDNCMSVSVRTEAVINQVYIDLDNIEMILADGSLQQEFFEKLSGITSGIYTFQEKQIDHLGLLFRFVK